MLVGILDADNHGSNRNSDEWLSRRLQFYSDVINGREKDGMVLFENGFVYNIKDETMYATDELKASSIDYYASLRSAYRQIRASEVRNGAPPPMEEFDDFSSLSDPPLKTGKAALELPQTTLTSEQ